MSALDIFRRNNAFSPFRNAGVFNDPVFRRMDRLFQELSEDVFNARMTGSHEAQRMAHFQPATDIEETDKAYMLHIDVPGIKKDDINVELQGNMITVSGERRFERHDEASANRYVERSYGRFERSFSLPENVNPESVEARFENGVLLLTLPKAESAQRRRIEVGGGEARMDALDATAGTDTGSQLKDVSKDKDVKRSA